MNLICNKAYYDGRLIKCRETGIGCAHVRYCDMKMKWIQTDNAKQCPANKEGSK